MIEFYNDIDICTDCYDYLFNIESCLYPDSIGLAFEKFNSELNERGYLLAHFDDKDLENHFSWSSCDLCHSHLGGDRRSLDVMVIPIDHCMA